MILDFNQSLVIEKNMIDTDYGLNFSSNSSLIGLRALIKDILKNA